MKRPLDVSEEPESPPILHTIMAVLRDNPNPSQAIRMLSEAQHEELRHTMEPGDDQGTGG